MTKFEEFAENVKGEKIVIFDFDRDSVMQRHLAVSLWLEKFDNENPFPLIDGPKDYISYDHNYMVFILMVFLGLFISISYILIINVIRIHMSKDL